MNFKLLSLLLFFLSFVGIVINSSNIIMVLICMEVLLISLSINFMSLFYYNEMIMGQLFFLYITSLAAVESALGLSMMMVFYKLKGSLSTKLLNLLKG